MSQMKSLLELECIGSFDSTRVKTERAATIMVNASEWPLHVHCAIFQVSPFDIPDWFARAANAATECSHSIGKKGILD